MDGTQVNQDDKTSGGKKGTSTKTYTEEEVTVREQNARSNALAEVGRAKAEAEKATKAANDAIARLAKMEQERIDAELEAHRDEPDVARRIRAEQEAKQAKANLAAREQELNEERERTKALQEKEAGNAKVSMVNDVAKSLNVDAEKLVRLSKFTDGSRQAIEEIAKDLPKAIPPKPGLKPDSNRSVGGGLSDEQIIADYIKDPYAPGVRQRYLELKAHK